MFEIDPEEFAMPFFKEEGFTRRQCPSCGSNFWASKPDQQTCGEVPCQPYSFIGNPPTKRSYTLREMRAQFLDYFTERGHTRIKPYPIVARWRDDVYLVGASIYDFQPYVTDGTMPPPANPLVISQPCVRFTDIEQVGPTAGRHMTIFEMGGHHAFNYPNKGVYWKDETVRYHHKLLVDVMGVSSDSITYKEHFWSGGGNAGPDLEGIVGGLEISTLVFMKFKIEQENLTPLPIRTVDTGYGIERWAWLSQGSPSGFHAVYGSLLDTVFKMSNVEVDRRIIGAFALSAGRFFASGKPWRSEASSWIAAEIGLDVATVQDMSSKLEAVYALTDHTKAASFLLADGIVPSNIGGGYLARLIIRRAARLARQLGVLDKITEIVEDQVAYWGTDFPLLKVMKSEILEGLGVELEKYRDTVARGTETVVRIAKELTAKGVDQIPTEDLVELYDSQGLPPEIVKESAEAVGARVEIPENFLALVAERHAKPATTSIIPDAVEKNAQELPATRALYYDTPYKSSFKAKIVARPTERTVVLDQTCFYPQGGGQPGDRGTLKQPGASVKVIDVQKLGNSIIHTLDQPLASDTELVEGEIDWDRRRSLMRHHTGTHILLGASRRVLGAHVWQAGAAKDVDDSRLDITHYSEITERERNKIVLLANQIIQKDVPVRISWMAREKAEAKYGFILYQGGAVPGSKIRVVTIPGWDVEACGGTHCKRTGELGLFRIEKTDRLQDGVERIIFSAGEPALKRVMKQEALLAETSSILGTTPDALPSITKTVLAERDKLQKEVGKTREKQSESHVNRLLKSAKKIGPVRLVMVQSRGGKDLPAQDTANKIREKGADIVAVIFEVSTGVQVVVAAGDDAVKAGINSADLVSELAKVLGGKGGGRPSFASGGGTRKDEVEKAQKMVEELVQNQLTLGITEKVA